MAYEDEPDGGYQLSGSRPHGTLLAWCVIALLLFAITASVIQ